MGFLPKLKIAHKLPIAVLLSALVVSGGVGGASYVIAQNAVVKLTQERLANAVAERGAEVATYLTGIKDDLLTRAGASTASTIHDFQVSWGQIKTGSASEVLRKAYIDNNPNPPGERILLDSATSLLSYNFLHRKVHPSFRTLIQQRGYYDLFLFDDAGNAVYTAFKEDDFGQNFSEGGGPYADTELGRVYRAAAAMQQPGEIAFSDFQHYAPSAGAPALFMATPVFDDQGRKQGVIALQLPLDKINAILNSTAGVGESGEVFLVGADRLRRNDSHHTTEDDTLSVSYENPLLDVALAGQSGSGEGTNEENAETLVSVTPLNIEGISWVVVAEEDKSEALAPVTDIRNGMLIAAMGLLALVAIAGFLFARSITRPMSRLTVTMDSLAKGNLDVEVAGAGRSDELGLMARSVLVFKENALKVGEMTESERLGSEHRRNERVSMMQRLQRAFGSVVSAATAGDFSQRVEASFPDEELNALARGVNELVETVDRGLSETGQVLAALADTDLTRRVEGSYEGAFERLKADTNAVANKLSEVVLGLKETSRSLRTATGEILAGANDLSERTTKQAATIEETSAAMEQLATTVLANSEQAHEASRAAAGVTKTAEEGGVVMNEANAAMERITASSGKISNIIGMIDDIAFQTNLLALNASVEAARAGDAGKGFAVVAVEVRRLAQSAASASAEVKALIEQSGTEVKSGSRLVAEAAQKLQSMLTAARSSNLAMDAIARASREQASSIEEVSAAVRQMDEMTQHNAALVEETNAAIEQTEAQAAQLDQIVEVFKVNDVAGGRSTEPARGIKALQHKVATAARSYLSRGGAAVAEKDWAEF
ncbi:methyl-accepting chemotaxis protein [Devosia sp.]|uniref:methyl-accepting chemotaxis protein n=1 Tax=Devosia sp. TaxID=1871048 RepID=UPI003BAA3F7C